jgi:hypothetical protein
MADLISMLAGAAGAGGVPAGPTDPNFESTVLLLHGDGTNGAQNNTFLDSSTNNFTITRNGNTTQGTFTPFSKPDGRWGNFATAASASVGLSCATSALVGSTTTTFTAECWIYMTDSPVSNDGVPALIGLDATFNSSLFLGFGPNASRQLVLRWFDGASKTATGGTTLNLNTWYHIAAVASSNALAIYVDGVAETLSGTTTLTNRNGTTNAFSLFLNSSASNYQFRGYASNIRVCTSAVYTTGFTPSTFPLTTTSQGATNCQLLTAQSNRFIDNSSNAYVLSLNGSPRVTPFSPFPITTAYDTSVNGGAGYFDGTGDYLSSSSTSIGNFGTGDFTVEYWINPSSLGQRNHVDFRGTAGSGGAFRIGSLSTNDKIVAGWDLSDIQLISTTTPNLNSWTHIAVTRSGTTCRLFINGVLEATTTSSYSIPDSGIIVGAYRGTSNYYIGYFSSLRIVKGTAVYTSAFTPPTAPLTAITNTSLLCNFTNAGIFDNTGKNNLETVGDAQIDTTTKKYGTGSMEFDGNGDWLLIPDSPDLKLGTGNFTIEFWVYLASGDTGSARGLVAKGGASTGWLVSLDSSQKVVFTYTTSTITSSGAITTNAWNHIAVVREGTGSNQTKIYIGGTNDGTGTVSTDFTQTEVMYIGANRTAGNPMKGFIDDLRVTKGIARYTANFTPPTAAFPDIGD